ncbi:restriction endonuclease subunit S [Allocoleopsis franciscana]|uniref:Restriction endonuclease S subunit n=1 Tax=Allocoleopsis franciscana PCC 7113 TaxID=1173027 RepID=K9WMS5_9CYAN|nr:restriction endonuclease subunit S [Allocoleopsis franciscana]AFZ21503.1 restriction endonuclease S subunit [Allocoleopsis franciscana PCC 7113]
MSIAKANKLPNGWRWVKLEEIADKSHYALSSGPFGSNLTSAHYQNTGVPVLRGLNISDGQLSLEDLKFISEEKAKELARSEVKPGDVVVVAVGASGLAFQIPESLPRAIMSQNFNKITPDLSQVNAKYLEICLNSDIVQSQLKQEITDTVRTFLSLTKLKDVEIPLPPLAEQKRIAAIAQKADRLRRTRRYALQLSDTYLRSVFLEMFGDPIANPKGWKTKLLDEISEVQGGLQLSQKRDNLELKLPYLRVANVYRNKLDLSEIKIIGLTKEEFIRVKLQKDDILIVEGHGNAAEIGRCAVWDGSIKDCVHQNHLIRVRVNLKIVNSAYLSHYINNSGGQKYFHTSSNTTSGLNTISTGIVKQCIVPIPPLPLQEKFAQIVQKFERIRTQQREGARQAEHLFQTLLHRAFRGELTPQDSNDEPASLLLEQIGAEQAQAEAEAKAATQTMGDAAEYGGTKAKQQDTEPI